MKKFFVVALNGSNVDSLFGPFESKREAKDALIDSGLLEFTPEDNAQLQFHIVFNKEGTQALINRANH